jgi:phage portal protein BeeE
MLESRQYSTEEIARAFRCPPALLGVTTPGAMSYASVEMNGIHFVTYCLRPYIVKIEDAYSNLIPGDATSRSTWTACCAAIRLHATHLLDRHPVRLPFDQRHPPP